MKTIIKKLQVGTVFLVALECCSLLLGTGWTSWAAPAAGEGAEPPSGMRFIVGGVYVPLFKTQGVEQATTVAPFYLDAHPVTNAQYVAFIQIVHRHEGLQQDLASTLEAIRRAVQD